MKTQMKMNQKPAQRQTMKRLFLYSAWTVGIASIITIVVFTYLNLANRQNAFAITSYSSLITGTWTTNGTWVGGTAPPTTSINNTTITVNANHTVTSGTLDVQNGTTFTVAANGTLYINGDLIVNNNLTLNIYGTLIITGKLDAKNSANITVNGGGTVKITGNATFANNATLVVNGTMNVGGAISFGSNPSFTGSGLVTVGTTGCSTFTGTGSCSVGTLPVKLLSLNAVDVNGIVKITWTTASEENNDYFTIERTTDGKTYTSLGKVTGAGTSVRISNYTYEDLLPLQGKAYYRLSQTDYDGKSEKFAPVLVEIASTSNAESFKMYPNPLTGNILNVSVTTPAAGTIEIINSSGNRVFIQELDSDESNIKITLNENTTPGIYFVNYRTSSMHKTERLVIR